MIVRNKSLSAKIGRPRKYRSERERDRAYYSRNRDKVKELGRRFRLKQYGLTPESYSEMVKSQEGRCLICGEHGSLVVDHDHRTGKVRGLLCDRCNRFLGIIETGITIGDFRTALNYLKWGELVI